MFNFVDFNNELLPNTICTSCFDSLSSAYNFFSKIKLSQIALNNLQHNEREIIHSKKENYNSHPEYHNFGSYNETQVTVTGGALYNSEENIYKHQSFSDLESSLSEHSNHEHELNAKENVDIIPLTESANVDCDSNHNDDTWNTYPWICKYCKTVFDTIKALRKHCKDFHSTCFGLKCADCRTCVNKYDVFVRHARKHRERLNNYCEFCNIKLVPEWSVPHLSTHISQPHCPACGETFVNYPLLENHLQLYQPKCKAIRKTRSFKKSLQLNNAEIKNDPEEETWREYPWICKFCNMQLPHIEMLRKHVKEYHGKCFGLSCVDCEKHLNDFKEFIEHVRDHRPNLKHYCQYCNFKFDNPTQSIIHKTNHLIKKVQCEECGELFQHSFDLQQHSKIYASTNQSTCKRRSVPVTVEDLTCSICQKTTKSLNNLRIHQKLHTNRNRDHTCDRCGKAFFTKGVLTAHILIHDQSDPQVCKICKKSFLTLTRLKKHVRTHYAEKPFQCGDCQRCFRLKDQLKSHMIIHSDLTPYKCQYCEKMFKHRNVLKVHENQHTGARPYVCDLCNMAFSNWSNCNKHMKRKHSMTIAKQIRTPQGPVPINPKTGKPKKLQDIEDVRDWTEKIMVPCKRGKKSDKINPSVQ